MTLLELTICSHSCIKIGHCKYVYIFIFLLHCNNNNCVVSSVYFLFIKVQILIWHREDRDQVDI